VPEWTLWKSTDDEVLAAVVAEERREIDLHRDHGDE
jgi:hypothetical protein